MIECLLIIAAFFAGTAVGWRSRAHWVRALHAFANEHGG